MNAELIGWDRLRHSGLLLDAQRLREVAAHQPGPLDWFHERELRRQAATLMDDGSDGAAFVAFVLEDVCGFTRSTGTWQRGSQVSAEWGRPAVTGETVKPRQLWQGNAGGLLPVFFDREKRVGIGRGRKATSQVLQWLRAGNERLALLTNGRQWRLVFAGLDFDAWCEWDVDLWFEEGALSPQIDALRTLIAPKLWVPPAADAPAPLLDAILASRKGQAELSAVLGERVREAVELLVQGHGEILEEQCAGVDPADIYRAAVRMVMRMVVILFAESRELLPRDNALYHGAYGLSGLLEELGKAAARGGNRLARSWNAWPRVLALFRLVFEGSHHAALPVPAYGGDLFAPGDAASADGLVRALAVFENACFDHELLPDRDVHRMLERITRTRVKLRQGRSSTWVPAPVDFSDLSSEYIGILYEGLLDFELKTAPAGDPVVFLAVGNQPALPLSRLEAMDDKALTSLLEKMKDTSKGEADAESEEEEPTDDEVAADEGADGEESNDALVGSEAEEVESNDGDERHATRTRAEIWARRAVDVGKLVRKPRGALTPERRLAYEEAIARCARQLVVRVLLPGEWYLVRWGGTRKGSGTFYTRPGLAVPTVQRTLRPLAYTPPLGADGAPDLDAPPAAWIPKTPEEILALKVCDPASGSGTFPVATLRFLTEALYASLHHHGRISEDGDRAVIRLLAGTASPSAVPEERLGQELLPCRPDDPLFEARLKAVLRRHVVERCIYGVDLDPLAVELCRLSLWIETMDRTLPFSFLDHKIKFGNALIGAWFDQFQHYPVMAWKNREGGDKGHNNGVHFQKDARGQALKAFVKDRLTPDLRRLLAGRTLFHEDLQEKATNVHAAALATLARLHDLPVQDTAERARIYREELTGSEAYRSLKAAMDLWCACWFWPADALEHAPLPTTLAAPSDETRATAARVATGKRFFHWELEFPDVFHTAGSGFDAMQGNPPWDIAKPSSMEFFSNIDPLYRSYGKQEALQYQSAIFADVGVERSWLDYNADFRAQSNWMGHASSAFGDPTAAGNSQDRFAIARGKDNDTLHARWREMRAKATGFTGSAHPFRYQGSADINLYKAFLEQVHALLRLGGRMGFVVPSGLYSDHGTGALRQLFLDRCRWEWLFGFENRDKVFEIDGRFKFNPVIIEKGGKTTAIRTAFMRRKLEDWEAADALATSYPATRIAELSPDSRAVLEVSSDRDLAILTQIASSSTPLRAASAAGELRYIKDEFDLSKHSKLFPPVTEWVARGFTPDPFGRWKSENSELALPMYEGRMIGQFDFSAKGWVSGKGRSAVWRDVPWVGKRPEPQFLISASAADSPVYGSLPGPRIVIKDVTSATNMRTIHAAITSRYPCGHTATIIRHASSDLQATLWLCGVLNSFVFDYHMRLRIGGLHATWNYLEEGRLPKTSLEERAGAGRLVARLALASQCFAPEWLSIRGLFPGVNWKRIWAVSQYERLRVRCMLDVLVLRMNNLCEDDARWVLRDCTEPFRESVRSTHLDPKGFWRVDKDKDPELRHTVLTLVAFHDLEEKIRACGGDRDKGIEAFLAQDDGEGWMLPETLRLADYGLGHDERAKQPQPVASRLGPRFFDWQLAQSAEESWRECHLHARNLLGEAGYQQLLADIEAEKRGEKPSHVAEGPKVGEGQAQYRLFPGERDLFGQALEDPVGQKRGR